MCLNLIGTPKIALQDPKRAKKAPKGAVLEIKKKKKRDVDILLKSKLN